MPKVLNKRDISEDEYLRLLNEGNTRYVGRPGKWGNPYKMGSEQTRKECVELYRVWALEHIEEIRKELKGKDLICWCAPEVCHADVLLEIANEEARL